jgi:very-short-patch-repair endonuclease
VLEVQSEKYHSSLSDRSHDVARFALLEAAGFTVVEITDEELFTLPQMVVERVLDAWRQLRRSA